jgi:SsrA-binding protein
MHKKEIMRLMGEVTRQGCALIPLSIYFNSQGRAKMQLGLCKGKKLYDKREADAQKSAQRDIERAIRDKF